MFHGLRRKFKLAWIVVVVATMLGALMSATPASALKSVPHPTGDVKPFTADGSISGSVVTSTASPASNVTVQLTDGSGTPQGTQPVTTNDGGLFTFPVVPAGNWFLVATPPPEAADVPSNPTPVQVGDGQAVTGVSLSLLSTTIVGHVYAMGSNVAVNAGVQFTGSNGTNYGTSVRTLNDGTYKAHLDQGTYNAQANPPQGSNGLSSTSPLQISVPQSVPQQIVQDFHLIVSTQNPGGGGGGNNPPPQQGNINGHAYEPGSSTTPAANAPVSLQIGFQGYGGGSTDNSGAFSIFAAPGTYSLVVGAPNNSPFASASAVTVVVGSDGTVVSPNPINVHLNAANVSGHVYGPNDNTPVANANVSVGTQDNSFSTYGSTGSDGSYHLFVPPSSGSYYLSASPPFGSQLARSNNATLTVPNSGPAVGTPSLDLHLRTVNFHGHVYLPAPSTTPVAGAFVNIHSADFTYNDGTQSDQDGSFSLAVSPGTYTLSISPQSGNYSAVPDVTVVVDNNGNVTAPQSFDFRVTQPNVSGHVYQPGSSTTPVNNSGVSIHTPDYSHFYNAQTGSDGAFALNLPTGTYVLSASAPYGSADFVPSSDVTIHINQAGQLVENSPLVVHLNAPNLSGTVLTANSTPAANANVQVRTTDYRFFTNAQTDNNGHYRLNLAAGSYVIFADPPYGSTGSGRSAEATFTVSQNGTVTGLPANLSLRVPNVTGHVYQPGSNNTTPVNNASASVRSTTDPSFFLNGQTDNGGNFAFTLAPGTYVLTGMAPQGSTYGNSVDTTFTVGNSDSTTIDIHLTTPNVTGTVLAPSPSSDPISNANVQISAVDQPLFFSAQTDNSGHFHVTVPNGSYRVSVDPADGSPYSRATDSTLDITNDHATATLNLRVTVPNVLGSVADTGNSPVAGANVTLQDNVNGFFANTRTDNSGQFRLSAPAGTYQIQAMPAAGSSDAGSDPQTVVIAGNGSGGTGLQLQFSSANVSGIVLPPTGNNFVANSFVTIHTDDWTTQMSAQSDSNGAFHFHMAPGDYIISAQPPYGDARYGRSFDVTVHVGNTGVAQTNLRLTSPNVTGTVYLPNGTAVANVNVSVRDDNNSFFSNAQTDTQGIFRLSVPASGTYIATADAPNGTSISGSAPVTLTVDANGVLTAPLPLQLNLTNPALVGQVFDPGANAGSTSDDVAVHGGNVNVHNNDFTIQQNAQIRQDGRFSVGALPAGTYTADVYPPWGSQGLLHVSQTVVIPSNPSQLPVTLESSVGSGREYLGVASETISVAVKRADNSNITTGADVQAFDQNGQFTDVKTPDNNGLYVLHVTPGTWNVNVMSTSTANDWVFLDRPVVIDPTACGSDPCVTLPAVQAGGHVTGTVTNNGNPVAANSAYVDVRTTTGAGNGAPVSSNGHFDIRVPAGTYQVSVHPQNDSTSGPAPVSVTIAGSETKDVGSIALVSRNSKIQGSVTFANPNPGAQPTPVVGAHVYAFQPGGGEFVDGNTQSDGTYSLNVTPGEWHVGIFAQAADTWINNNPPQTVTVAPNANRVGTNFTVSASAATLKGQVLTPQGNVASLDGFVQATSSTGSGGGAPLVNGTFSIPLTAGTFTLELFLAPNSPYSPPPTQQVTVASNGQVAPAVIQLVSNDRQVSGQVVGANGSPLTGTDVVVSATKGSLRSETHTDSNGAYHLALADGQWSINARVVTPGYNLLEVRNASGTARPGPVTLDAQHVNVVRNVAIVPASRTLTGSVHGSGGSPIQGAFVNIDSAVGATTVIHAGVNTDASGTFAVAVPDGSYVVNASGGGAPGDVAPSAVNVTINANGQTPGSAVLDFRHPASSISGRVTNGGNSIAATVTAWSGSGGFVSTMSDASTGAYTLPVTDNDTWHVSASAPNPATAGSTLVGPSASVPLAPGASATNIDFALAAVVVPSGLTTTFDSATGRTISLGADTPSPADDVTITVPAGALATTGNVSVTATPIASPNETSSTHPIGLGYSFEAFDAAGQPIRTSFNRPLTITFGYDDGTLTAAGLTPEDLVPSYWDPTSQTYRRTDTAVADTVAHKITFTTDHFTSWVVAASATAPTAPRSVSATTTGPTSALVSWIAPAVDGGSAITGYTVMSSGGQTATAGASATSVAITGLTTGTSYTFTVHATNAVGNSVESAASGALIAGSAGTSGSGGAGYLLIAADGGIFNHGGAGFFGSAGAIKLNSPIVGGASTPSGSGYWLVAADGGIFSYGDATFYGSAGARKLNKPIVGMAATPSGHGYWLVASDGGIFSYGDATFYGSTGAMKLNKPIVGMSKTPTGLGYWLVASDGGIFSYGDATFYGSAGATKLNKPIVAMHSTASGHGYWLVASDGGIFSYGDATFYGSAGATKLNKPVVGMKVTTSGLGYWLVTSDGGIFNYGDASFSGSEGATKLNSPVIGLAG